MTWLFTHNALARLPGKGLFSPLFTVSFQLRLKLRLCRTLYTIGGKGGWVGGAKQEADLLLGSSSPIWKNTGALCVCLCVVALATKRKGKKK